MEDWHIVLGIRDGWGGETPFVLPPHDRRHHLYVVGKSGTGKTTFLRNLILQDIVLGHGVGVIDPHGDLCAKRTLSFSTNLLRRGTRFRVSDEGGFWASMAVRPRAARKPRERQKPTEVGEATEGPNTDKTLVNKGRLDIRGYPRRGEGCGEPLN